MSTIESQKMICLKSSDGDTFEVEEAVAVESQIIKNMVEDNCVDNVIQLPNVTSKILTKVIEYCKLHADATAKAEANGATATDKAVSDEEMKAFDAAFVKVDEATLFDLISAANYLNIKSLLNLTCQTVADMIKGKSPYEILSEFNIPSRYIPELEEEEEEVPMEDA